jgi:hypothetical protein
MNGFLVLLLNALVQSSGNIESDEAWLNLLMQQSWDEEILKNTILKIQINQKCLINFHHWHNWCMVDCFTSSVT